MPTGGIIESVVADGHSGWSKGLDPDAGCAPCEALADAPGGTICFSCVPGTDGGGGRIDDAPPSICAAARRLAPKFMPSS